MTISTTPVSCTTRRRALLVGLVLSIAAAPAFAHPQSKGQQKCLNAIGKSAAAVARSQDKENSACLGLAAKGAVLPGGTAETCLLEDPKGKVEKAEAKTVEADAASCTPVPDFGYGPAASVNEAAGSASLSLLADLFGNDLDAAVALCETDKAACGCQAGILKAATSSAAAKLKSYLGCKTEALKAGAHGVDDLAACVNDGATPGSIAADTKGKLAGKDAKLEDAASKCSEDSLVTDTLFPGECVGRSGDPDFANCIDDRVECRVCEMLNGTEGLGVDCDLFDDAAANASCVDFAGSALFSVGADRYVAADAMTLALGAADEFPASSLNYFELVDTDGIVNIIATGNGKYLRVEAMDSIVYADAADPAAATDWVVFVQDGSSDPMSIIVLRDGPPSAAVDALEYDGVSGKLKLVSVPIEDAVSEARFQFLLYQ